MFGVFVNSAGYTTYKCRKDWFSVEAKISFTCPSCYAAG
jgi:hypothetical protein